MQKLARPAGRAILASESFTRPFQRTVNALGLRMNGNQTDQRIRKCASGGMCGV